MEPCPRRPLLLLSSSSHSWPPYSWPWAWGSWSGSFVRRDRQKAPTGPAAKSSSQMQPRPSLPRNARTPYGGAFPSSRSPRPNSTSLSAHPAFISLVFPFSPSVFTAV